MKHTFLFIGEDAAWSKRLEQALSPIGRLWIVREESLEIAINRRHYNLTIIDASHIPDVLKLITRLRGQQPEMHIVVAAQTRTWKRAQEALGAGATDYILKSGDDKKIREEIRAALEKSLPSLQHNEISQKAKKDNQVRVNILLADNDLDFINTRAEFLKNAGYKVVLAVSPTDAKKLLENGEVDLAILDIRLNDDDDEKDISGLNIARTVAPFIPKIMLTNFPTGDNVRDSLGYVTTLGMPAAVDFLDKKEGPSGMIGAVSNAIGNFIEKEETVNDSSLDVFNNMNHSQVLSSKKKFPILVLDFVFVMFPKAVGRFIFDIFGREKASDISATMLGYITILIVFLIVQGFINPDEVLNLSKDVWRFFFPVK